MTSRSGRGWTAMVLMKWPGWVSQRCGFNNPRLLVSSFRCLSRRNFVSGNVINVFIWIKSQYRLHNPRVDSSSVTFRGCCSLLSFLVWVCRWLGPGNNALSQIHYIEIEKLESLNMKEKPASCSEDSTISTIFKRVSIDLGNTITSAGHITQVRQLNRLSRISSVR